MTRSKMQSFTHHQVLQLRIDLVADMQWWNVELARYLSTSLEKGSTAGERVTVWTDWKRTTYSTMRVLWEILNELYSWFWFRGLSGSRMDDSGSDRGEKLGGREETQLAFWQEQQRDAGGMNHNTILVLLVECFLVLLSCLLLHARGWLSVS